jgi:MSHA biogenesis protein MshQ
MGAPGAPTYSLPNPYPSATPPPGPTDIYLRAVDSDAVTSLRGGSSIEGGIKIVSGRTLIASAYGSELLKLPIGVTVQYWNGTRYVTSLTDSVTTFGAGNVAFTNCQKFLNSGAVPPDNCKPTVAVATSPGSVAIGNGVGSFSLSAPGPGNGGSADVTIKVPSYLPSTTARAGFGQYRAPLIYMRENY